MGQIHLLRLSFLAALILGLFHFIATTLYLYSYYWWWVDIPPHFLGGLSAGFFSLWLSVCFLKHKEGFRKNSLPVVLQAVLGALIVGIVWEIFEYLIGITFNALNNYSLDVFKDLVVDSLGGYFAFVLSSEYSHNSNR